MKKANIIGSAILVVLGIFAPVFGQTENHTENNKDQALRGSGRVNPSTLAMEFQLPLGSYPGRGINVPISLSYSSKVWRSEYINSQSRVNNPGDCISINMPKYAENSASGWTTSLAAPYIEYTGWDNIFNALGYPPTEACDDFQSPPPDYDNAVIKRITVYLPSGETHELRVDDTPHTYDPATGSPPAADGTYYATDSSNIIYIEDAATNTYKLLMPDGSFYNLKTGNPESYNLANIRKAEKFTDRNGNYTTYNDSNNTWTDTLGRTLAAPLGLSAPTSPTTQTYTMPGIGGTTSITYKFYWKKLKDTTEAESGLTDFNLALEYLADRSSADPNETPRTSGYLFQSEWMAWLHDGGAPVFNPIVLTGIELPTGQKYKFTYDIYGRIEKIFYPTGGEESFVYSVVDPLTPSNSGNVSDQMNFGVTDRKVYQTAGQGTPYEWTYGVEYASPNGYKVTINNPDDTKVERFLHRGNGSSGFGTFGFDNGLAGMPYEELGFNSDGDLVSRKLSNWTKKSFAVNPGNASADWHPRVTHEESYLYDANGNGVYSTVKFEYEGDLDLRATPVLQKKTLQYGFLTTSGGSSFGPGGEPDPDPTPIPTPTPSTLLRTAESTFMINDTSVTNRQDYKDRNMVGLITASVVKNASGIVVSRSEMKYDESGSSPQDYVRGNPTTSRVWDSTKGAETNSSAYIETTAKFDTYGNQYESTDATGCTTETDYDTTYHTFPETVTTCAPDSSGVNGSSSGFVTTATFDPTTGLPLTTTDANETETAIEYDEDTLRPVLVRTAHGTSNEAHTETIYHDETGNYWVKTRTQIDDINWKEAITYFDGLGRAYKAEQVDSEGNIFVDKEFDAEGRVLRVSNPHRSGESKQWTTNSYDEASRIKEVTLPDGSSITTDYGVSTTTGSIGATKQITDQAGKKRKGISDALGRMVRVIEDPGTLGLNTDYLFDTLGNLRKITHGDQTRYFMHDSLGRLLYAKQPEQDTNSGFSATDPVTGNTGWSVKYEYDDSGNITKTTDARGVYVEGTYDKFNRITFRNYSDSTPDVDFYYDGTGLGSAPDYSKGKTTKVTSSVSETRFTSFDNLGRLLTHEQRTDGETYETEYKYNLSGALIEETYPSGRVVRNTLDEDGELSMVQSRKNQNYGYFAYAMGFSYNASGSVEKMRLGNGRWENFAYNSREQIKQIGLGITDSTQDLLKLEYEYETDPGTSTDNNGSLRKQKITVPTTGGSSGFTAEQTYTYDDLNRLLSAAEKIGTSDTWKQTFTFDRYGNRRFDAANTTTLGSCSAAVCNPDISTTNNRFTTTGYAYDENGNLTEDAEGQRFTYDAENHQTEFFLSSNSTETPDATYRYDGDGRRVRKISATEATIFVYNAGGTLVAEYSTDLAETQQVSYLTSDHLGSPRVITNETGEVTTRKDYAAFGEETFTSDRVSGLSYSSSQEETRKGYTGYEKDDESGLDFAQARYYNPTHGRYTSVDPLTASASIRNPQTFNRYSYVLNSPYKFTDPLGLLSEYTGACGSRCANGGAIGGGMVSTYGNAFQAIQGTNFTLMRQVAQAIAAIKSGAWEPGSGVNETGLGESTKIGQALLNILKFGTETAKNIANNIVNSNIAINVTDTTGSANTASTEKQVSALNQELKNGRTPLSTREAMAYLTITIPRSEFTNQISPEAAIEGTLVHEGYHALTIAGIISSISAKGNLDKNMQIDEFDAKEAGINYAIKRGGNYIVLGTEINKNNSVTPGIGEINSSGYMNVKLVNDLSKSVPNISYRNALKNWGVKW